MSQRERKRTPNYKPFSVNAPRKGGQGPTIRRWLEQTVNSFSSHELFQTETHKEAGCPRDMVLDCWKPY